MPEKLDTSTSGRRYDAVGLLRKAQLRDRPRRDKGRSILPTGSQSVAGQQDRKHGGGHRNVRRRKHARLRFWPAVLLAGVVILSACGAASTPATGGVATSPPSPLPTTVAEATSTPLPTEQTAVTAEAVAVSPLSPPPTALPDTPTPVPTQEATATSPSPEAEGEANADVLHVRAVQASDGSWMFQVKVEHPDTGWDDYADGWDVVTPDGEVLKPDPASPFTRLLLHPHVGEQPFTRSQSGIVIPPGVTQVRVRAHDLVDGWGGREVVVDLTVQQSEDFEVEAAP